MSHELTQMNQIMQQYFKRASTLSDQQFHWKSTEEEWSLQQVLLHLVQIQTAGVTVLSKQVQQLDSLHKKKVEKLV